MTNPKPSGADEILRELVACKDLEARVDSLQAVSDYGDPEYTQALHELGRRKLPAWAAARAHLAQPAQGREAPKVDRPCKCGRLTLQAHTHGSHWYWQLHRDDECVVYLPNERCWCGLLRSEHVTGHAEPSPTPAERPDDDWRCVNCGKLNTLDPERCTECGWFRKAERPHVARGNERRKHNLGTGRVNGTSVGNRRTGTDRRAGAKEQWESARQNIDATAKSPPLSAPPTDKVAADPHQQNAAGQEAGKGNLPGLSGRLVSTGPEDGEKAVEVCKERLIADMPASPSPDPAAPTPPAAAQGVEPVAWISEDELNWLKSTDGKDCLQSDVGAYAFDTYTIPLYLAPPALAEAVQPEKYLAWCACSSGEKCWQTREGPLCAQTNAGALMPHGMKDALAQILKLEADLARKAEECASLRRELERLQGVFDAAVAIQGDDEVLKYVASLNAIPVTRCTVSADLIRQLVQGRQAAEQDAAALREDAERYRWLRSDMAHAYGAATFFIREHGHIAFYGEGLDELIDTAKRGREICQYCAGSGKFVIGEWPGSDFQPPEPVTEDCDECEGRGWNLPDAARQAAQEEKHG